MGCGVLVVSPRDPARRGVPAARTVHAGPPRIPPASGAGPAAEPADGAELAELLRSAGHQVLECPAPESDGGARGLLDEAWVVLAGVDLVVIVDDPGEAGHPSGPVCARARELMTDRGPGGAIAWVPGGVRTGTAAAALLELADEVHGDVPARSRDRAPVLIEIERVGPRPEEPRPDASRPVASRPDASRPDASRQDPSRPEESCPAESCPAEPGRRPTGRHVAGPHAGVTAHDVPQPVGRHRSPGPPRPPVQVRLR